MTSTHSSLEIPLSITATNCCNQMCYLRDMWPLVYLYYSRRDDSTGSPGLKKKRKVSVYILSHQSLRLASLRCGFAVQYVRYATQHSLIMQRAASRPLPMRPRAGQAYRGRSLERFASPPYAKVMDSRSVYCKHKDTDKPALLHSSVLPKHNDTLGGDPRFSALCFTVSGWLYWGDTDFVLHIKTSLRGYINTRLQRAAAATSDSWMWTMWESVCRYNEPI